MAGPVVLLQEIVIKNNEVNRNQNNNSISNALCDHDYIRSHTKPQTNTKQTPKMTRLTAIYNCKICGYTTMKKDVIDRHRYVHKHINPGTAYVPCNSCNIVKNPPKGYEQCPDCSYYTKSKSSLKVHMRIHSQGKSYKCTECVFTAKHLRELILHHNEVKDLQCDQCSYSTHVKDRLLSHKRTHCGAKPYICGICFYLTNGWADLQKHMQCHGKVIGERNNDVSAEIDLDL